MMTAHNKQLRRACTDPDDVLRANWRAQQQRPDLSSGGDLVTLPRLARLRSDSVPLPLTYCDPDWDWSSWEERPLPEGSAPPPTSFTFRQRAADALLRQRSAALDIAGSHSLGGQRVTGAARSLTLRDSERSLLARPDADYDDFRSALAESKPGSYAGSGVRSSAVYWQGSSDLEDELQRRPSRQRRQESSGDLQCSADDTASCCDHPPLGLPVSSDSDDDFGYAYAYDCVVSPAEVILSDADHQADRYTYAKYGAANRENIYEELPDEPPPLPPGPRYPGQRLSQHRLPTGEHLMHQLSLDVESTSLYPHNQSWYRSDLTGGASDPMSPDSGFQSASGSGSTVCSSYDPGPAENSSWGSEPRPRPRWPTSVFLSRCESLDFRLQEDAWPDNSSHSSGRVRKLKKWSAMIGALMGKYNRYRSRSVPVNAP